MGKDLVIVESPTKVKSISKYLGNNYVVSSSKGHIRDLSTKGKYGLGVDIENHFKPDYKTIKGKKSVIDELKKEHGEVKLTSIGSSIKICLVAEGTADIYPRFAPTMEWDTAAGHAIAKAAGKELYHQDGCTPLAYNKEDLLNPWFIVK